MAINSKPSYDYKRRAFLFVLYLIVFSTPFFLPNNPVNN